MNMDNAGELVSLGTDIVKLGSQLKDARVELEAAAELVKKIESELQPKLLRHAELIQQAAGLAFPARAPSLPPQQQTAPLPDWAPPIANLIPAPGTPAAPGPDLGLTRSSDPAKTAEGQLKQRVKDYLRKHNGEEGVSATDVADVLRVDALLVREAMREMRGGR
jgi:hypothetical protein